MKRPEQPQPVQHALPVEEELALRLLAQAEIMAGIVADIEAYVKHRNPNKAKRIDMSQWFHAGRMDIRKGLQSLQRVLYPDVYF